jgi:hypothetical protein
MGVRLDKKGCRRGEAEDALVLFGVACVGPRSGLYLRPHESCGILLALCELSEA